MATDTPILYKGIMLASATGDSITQPQKDAYNNTGLLNYTGIRELWYSVNLYAGVNGATSIQVLVSTSDGNTSGFGGSTEQWYNFNSQAAFTGIGNYLDCAGPGTGHNLSLGQKGRVTWNIVGVPTAPIPMWITIYGKA